MTEDTVNEAGEETLEGTWEETQEERAAMEEEERPRGRVVEIRRRFAAPADRVFEAFRDPELLREWAAPAEHRNERVESDFRVGGRYRREMRLPDGSLHVLSGEYLEIDPPRRLAYTYVWETMPGAPETRVEIDFLEREEETEVRLVHSGFGTEEMADGHRTGWDACLRQLADLLRR